MSAAWVGGAVLRGGIGAYVRYDGLAGGGAACLGGLAGLAYWTCAGAWRGGP